MPNTTERERFLIGTVERLLKSSDVAPAEMGTPLKLPLLAPAYSGRVDELQVNCLLGQLELMQMNSLDAEAMMKERLDRTPLAELRKRGAIKYGNRQDHTRDQTIFSARVVVGVGS